MYLTVTIEVNKAHVIDKVGEIASYVGSKSMHTDKTAYDRNMMTDEDRYLVDRYWLETCQASNDTFKDRTVGRTSQTVEHDLDLSRNWNITLNVSPPEPLDTDQSERIKESLDSIMTSYFVHSIAAKWLSLTDSDESERESRLSVADLLLARRTVYYIGPTEKDTIPDPSESIVY